MLRAFWLFGLAGALAAQEAPALHLAFAAERDGPPALAWLRQDVIAQRPEWPAGRDPDAPFALHLDAQGLRVGDAIPLPAGTAAAGEGTLPGGITWRFACGADGHDELVLGGREVPQRFDPLLQILHAAVDGAPRLVDVTALVGNLLGPTVDGDGLRELLPLAAARCGETTFAVTRGADDSLRVRGGSDGGLWLPAAVLWLALDGSRAPAGSLDPAAAIWRLRASGSRDGDRAEAARQLQRAGAAAVPGLRALLHGDEECRLAAIDGLRRLRAVGELPRVVAAADPTMPLSVRAAAATVQDLWADAPPVIQNATRTALERNPALGADTIPTDAPALEHSLRDRMLVLLALGAMGLFGLWQRERALLRLGTSG